METKDSGLTDIFGRKALSANDFFALLMSGKKLRHVIIEDSEEFTLFKEHQDNILRVPIIFENPLCEGDLEVELVKRSDEWLFPDEYKKIDVLEWLLQKCNTELQKERVRYEFKLYQKHDLIVLLQFFIYLIDYMRENKFLWGVGRGSSLASYILYLIGTHRVDSLKYNLDINDFLR